MDRDFERIVNTYADMLFRICMHYSQTAADGEDIVQQTFLKIIEKNIVFENPEHEKAWLIRVCINLCKDNLKSKKRKSDSFSPLTKESSPCFDRLYITDQIRRLPSKHKAAIYLFYYENMSVNEIAETMQEKPNTVLSYLNRGRKKLAKLLKEEL